MTSPPKRLDLTVHEIEEEGETVLYDAKGKRLLVLNPVGAGVWSLCDGEHTVAAIADLIVEVLGADRTRVVADVERFLDELEHEGLIEAR